MVREMSYRYLMKSFQQVWAFLFVCFCIAQLKVFDISTEHCLEKKMKQLLIAEVGPEPASVPFKKFIQ